MDDIAKTRKCYSRKHTKEERKAEKRRCRERQKLFKKRPGQSKHSQAVQTDNVVQAHMSVSLSSNAVEQSRGKKIVQLSQQHQALKKQPQQSQHSKAMISISVSRIHREDLPYKVPDDKIGSGSYGRCYKGTYRGNIPVVVKNFRSSVNAREILHEEVMQDIQWIEHHSSLPLLIGISVNAKPCLLVSQFHGNNMSAYTLSTAIKSKLLAASSEWLDVLITLAQALGFIHQKGWVHDDLKENNVVLHLMNDKWQPVIIDFGKSVRAATAKCGTKTRDPSIYYWKAPELLACLSPPSFLSDMYSLCKIIKLVGNKINVAESFSELFLCCLASKPSMRPSSAQMVAAKLETWKISFCWY